MPPPTKPSAPLGSRNYLLIDLEFQAAVSRKAASSGLDRLAGDERSGWQGISARSRDLGWCPFPPCPMSIATKHRLT